MTLEFNETIRRRDGTLTNLQDFCEENGGDTSEIEQEISALADDVSTNTSAISSITSQLSALVDDVGANTSAISEINTALNSITFKVVQRKTIINGMSETISKQNIAETANIILIFIPLDSHGFKPCFAIGTRYWTDFTLWDSDSQISLTVSTNNITVTNNVSGSACQCTVVTF